MTDAGKDFGPFEEDVWELYDMRKDFGLGTDLSAEHPDKLREFQELFDREARKHNNLSDGQQLLRAVGR